MPGSTESLLLLTTSDPIEVARLKAIIADLEEENSGLRDRCSSLEDDARMANVRAEEAEEKAEELQKEIDDPEDIVEQFLGRETLSLYIETVLFSNVELTYDGKKNGEYIFVSPDNDKQIAAHEKEIDEVAEQNEKSHNEEVEALTNRITCLEETIEMMRASCTAPNVEEILHGENQMAGKEDRAQL